MAGELLGTKEASEYLGVSYWTLMNVLIHEIPHIQRTTRGKIKFKKSTLDKYLEKQEEKSLNNSIDKIEPDKKSDDIVELSRKYNQRTEAINISELLGR